MAHNARVSGCAAHKSHRICLTSSLLTVDDRQERKIHQKNKVEIIKTSTANISGF